MAENSMIVEVGKLGQTLVDATAVIKQAAELQHQIAGYETQAERLKGLLVTDRKSLEEIRTQKQVEAERLRIARETADGAEVERDRRLGVVAAEEEVALSQLRVVSQRDRERIQREMDTLALELESKKQGVKAEVETERHRLQGELGALEADIQAAKDELQKVRDTHARFVESLTRPMDDLVLRSEAP